ncbi:MAG: molecular chaperone [Oscillospiraceae bacterium]
MYHLTKAEKETIILFNEYETDAEVYTFNPKLQRKLRERANEYPEIYQLQEDKQYGSVTCRMPKSSLSVSLKKPISEERRTELRKRALKSKPHLAIK